MSEKSGDPRTNVGNEFKEDWNNLIDHGLIPGGEKIGDPEPTAVKEEAKPKEKPAPTPDESGKAREWAGKYDSPEAMEKGYKNAEEHLVRLTKENKAFREQEALRSTQTGTAQEQTPQAYTEPVATPPAPVDWMANPAVKKFSEITGTDPSAGAEMAQGIYEAAVNAAVKQATQVAQEAVAPIYARGEADAYMAEKHSEAFKFTPEIAAYMETADPVVQATFRNEVAAKNYAGASKMAWLAYREDSGLSAQTQMKAEAKESESEQQTQKADAGVTATAPGTTPHTARDVADGPTQSEILELAAQARTSGDQKDQVRYRDATIGDMLKRDPAFQNMLTQHALEDERKR